MSEIAGRLAQIREAFERPTLALLSRGKRGPVVLAVLMSSFSQNQDPVPAEQLHAQVRTYLAELAAAGEEVPDDPPRVLCRRWVKEQWLVLAANEDHVEEYALTSHAQEAIDYVKRLSGDRSMFSQSRIKTILDAARRCANDANPDREERVRRLDDEIRRLTAERDRICGGGEIEIAPDDRVLEEYLNLRDLIAQLPADFLRVSEAVKAIQRVIVGEFRAEGRRAGHVLDLYLERSSDLMTESAEGRAFVGAVELLRDDRLLKELRDDLKTILEHPFAVAVTPAEARDFRNTVIAVRHGMGIVQEQRRRLSATLRAHIARHDALRERELDEALRRCRSELASWMEKSGPRSRAGIALDLPSLEVAHLRQRFYNPGDHIPPLPLADTQAEAADPTSLEELRRQGGPDLGALRELVTAAVQELEAVSAGEVFASAEAGLRRPVEVFGLLHIAAATGAKELRDSGEADLFEAVRPDGTRRSFTTTRTVFTHEQLGALEAHDLDRQS
ncbi:DUF3375 domain-containing protein [Trebonia kvetii]|uniref:DUF3375 domain-containing protein n=1 Tax=Trebonia kvetii TaxID=2480626 RepID=UPI0016524C5A|nr:DUF3375 domain-containing protein [Trebonia kvetii]